MRFCRSAEHGRSPAARPPPRCLQVALDRGRSARNRSAPRAPRRWPRAPQDRPHCALSTSRAPDAHRPMPCRRWRRSPARLPADRRTLRGPCRTRPARTSAGASSAATVSRAYPSSIARSQFLYRSGDIALTKVDPAKEETGLGHVCVFLEGILQLDAGGIEVLLRDVGLRRGEHLLGRLTAANQKQGRKRGRSDPPDADRTSARDGDRCGVSLTNHSPS